MDFIARAGNVLDRSHRLAGVLLVIVVVETLLLMNVMDNNKALNLQYDRLREKLYVYVVPGSLAGVYSPKQDDMLVEAFTTLISQSLNTYTYENLTKQYSEVKQFFSPSMLVSADKYFGEKIKIARLDTRSSLFVPNKDQTKVEVIRDARGSDTGDKRIIMEGQLYHILTGNPVEALPVRITMALSKVNVTRSNPFGFMLKSYTEEEIEESK
jgi:hypothetical protein